VFRFNGPALQAGRNTSQLAGKRAAQHGDAGKVPRTIVEHPAAQRKTDIGPRQADIGKLRVAEILKLHHLPSVAISREKGDDCLPEAPKRRTGFPRRAKIKPR